MQAAKQWSYNTPYWYSYLNSSYKSSLAYPNNSCTNTNISFLASLPCAYKSKHLTNSSQLSRENPVPMSTSLTWSKNRRSVLMPWWLAVFAGLPPATAASVAPTTPMTRLRDRLLERLAARVDWEAEVVWGALEGLSTEGACICGTYGQSTVRVRHVEEIVTNGLIPW